MGIVWSSVFYLGALLIASQRQYLTTICEIYLTSNADIAYRPGSLIFVRLIEFSCNDIYQLNNNPLILQDFHRKEPWWRKIIAYQKRSVLT